MTSEQEKLLYGVLSLLLTILAAVVIADPDLPARIWYRFRLTLAYKESTVNWDRLRHMRALRWAGYYDSDLVPEGDHRL